MVSFYESPLMCNAQAGGNCPAQLAAGAYGIWSLEFLWLDGGTTIPVGTWPVSSSGPTPNQPRVVTAAYVYDDAYGDGVCDFTEFEGGGSVTVTSSSASEVKGSVNIQWSRDGDSTGTFDAVPACATCL